MTTVRICSLLPSATEIVGALGLSDALVGVSEECDWPPEARSLPVVTASRVDATALDSRAIDRAVRDALADGRPLYAVDEELITGLEPDLILTQDLCAVCAVASGDLGSLRSLEGEIVSIDAHTIAEIEASVLELARRLGVPERGGEVVGEMESKLAEVGRVVFGAPRRRVFVCEWLEPVFAAGHWLPEMVEVAGGQEILGRPGEPSFPTTWDDVVTGRPELVVVAPCGFGAGRAAREASLPALGCPAVAVDANAYYSRPAPRIADGVRQLAHLIHPERAPDPGLPAIHLQ
jgi:iron complex transport system substrate-binding protein